MKLIICLLFLSLYISSCVGYEFVNLEVYQDEQCTQPGTYGVGYSTVVDTCTTIDFVSNYIFRADKDKQEISLNLYKNIMNTEMCNVPNGDTQYFSIGQCIPYNSFNLDVYEYPISPFYYKLTVSPSPIIAKNSMAQLFYAGSECQSDQVLLSKYYINGTGVGYLNPNAYQYYFCANNVAAFYSCPKYQKGNCNKYSNRVIKFPMVCQDTNQPFYNSSSDYNVSGSCTSGGCYTGNTGENTGTNGGTSGGSGSSNGNLVQDGSTLNVGLNGGEGDSINIQINKYQTSSNPQTYSNIYYCS